MSIYWIPNKSQLLHIYFIWPLQHYNCIVGYPHYTGEEGES